MHCYLRCSHFVSLYLFCSATHSMSLECTFTLGIVSRGHIWAYIRDVLTIICQV